MNDGPKYLAPRFRRATSQHFAEEPDEQAEQEYPHHYFFSQPTVEANQEPFPDRYNGGFPERKLRKLLSQQDPGQQDHCNADSEIR